MTALPAGLIALWVVMATNRISRVKSWKLPVLRGRTIGEVLDSYPYQRDVEWVKTGMWTTEFRCELLIPEGREDILRAFLRLRFRVTLTGVVLLNAGYLRMVLRNGKSPEKALDMLELILVLNRYRHRKPIIF